MAWDDILFDQGEETNFILELPSSSFSGPLGDMLTGDPLGQARSFNGTLVYDLPARVFPSIGGKHVIRSNN